MDMVTTGLFDTYEHARQAVADLEANGVPHRSISLVANNSDNRYDNSVVTADDADPNDAVADGAGTGASLGTVVGGGAGLLAGLGILAIPGVGPVVAAGWLVAPALGAGVGAASGGLLGSLVGAGVSETDAHVYAEGVRRGGTLVTVRTENSRGAMVEEILARHSTVDVSTRADGIAGAAGAVLMRTRRPTPRAPARALARFRRSFDHSISRNPRTARDTGSNANLAWTVPPLHDHNASI